MVAEGAEKEFYGAIKELEKNHVVRYAYETVEMDNGTILSISKAYRLKVRERLLKG